MIDLGRESTCDRKEDTEGRDWRALSMKEVCHEGEEWKGGLRHLDLCAVWGMFGKASGASIIWHCCQHSLILPRHGIASMFARSWAGNKHNVDFSL